MVEGLECGVGVPSIELELKGLFVCLCNVCLWIVIDVECKSKLFLVDILPFLGRPFPFL